MDDLNSGINTPHPPPVGHWFIKGVSKMDFTALATAMGTAVTTAITASVPVIVIVLGTSIGYRLFKRFIKG